MDSVKMREAVEAGKTILGIEFGNKNQGSADK